MALGNSLGDAVDRAQPRSFAIVTPSYYRDFEACRLLVESVQRFVAEPVHHYLLVDRSDEKLFAPLRSKRTHLVLKEDLLPWWLHQAPFARKWWLSLKSLPVRGWVAQQLAKLSVHRAVSADALVYLDSGGFFVRPYDPAKLVRGDKVPLFREHGEQLRGRHNDRWHALGAQLLGLRRRDGYLTSYVNNLVFWRRDNLVALHEHVERTTGRPLVESLCYQLTMSEYVLYGMFCEHVLGIDASGHYETSNKDSYWYYPDTRLDVPQLRRIRDELTSDQVVVMINEKSRTPMSDIRRVFIAEGP